VFVPIDFTHIEAALASPAGWWELVIVAVCFAIGWMLDRRLRLQSASEAEVGAPRPRQRQPDAAAARDARTDARRRRRFSALASAVLPPDRHPADGRSGIDPPHRLRDARALRRAGVAAVGRSASVSFAIWGIVLLHFTGVLPELWDELDALDIPVGSKHVSVLELLKGSVALILTIAGCLWLSGLIEQRLQRAGKLDSSVRAVISKFVRALLLAAGVLIALQAVGIDLTVLTVFGGALGVGIGLGLQKLASNYIAGFTILLDRSIRLGDLITVDNRLGVVAKVTARYVIVRSLDGVEAVVPNETLVTTTVLNHSYSNREIRTAAVQVSHDTDIDLALKLMEAAAHGRAACVKSAERAGGVRGPIRRGGIDLELGVWINDPEKASSTCEARSQRDLEVVSRERHQDPGAARDVRCGHPPSRSRTRMTSDRRVPPPDRRRNRLNLRSRATRRPTGVAIFNLLFCSDNKDGSGPPSAVRLQESRIIQANHNGRDATGRDPKKDCYDVFRFAWFCRAWIDAASMVGLFRCRAGDDPRHHRLRDDLPAPCASASRARPHPAISHFFRFWLWLTTGMVTKEWVAIHRKHHARVETPDDPHSPQTRGINTVFWQGTELYRAEAKNAETIDKFGRGTPDDWMERNVYTRFSWEGVGLMLMVNFMLFGGAAWRSGPCRWRGFQSRRRASSTASATTGVIAISLGRRLEEHRPLGHSHRRRGAPQQPSRVWNIGEAVVALVRIRSGMDLHPDPRDAWPCPGAQGRADPAGSARRQGDARRRDTPGGDRKPLRRRDRLRAHAEGHVCDRARATARACRPQRLCDVPSVRRLKRWLSGDKLTRCASMSMRCWRGRWRRAARFRRSTRCARS
jgi:hypothetical protein